MVHPAGTATVPLASTSNFVGGEVVASMAVVRLGQGGAIGLYTSAQTHLSRHRHHCPSPLLGQLDEVGQKLPGRWGVGSIGDMGRVAWDVSPARDRSQDWRAVDVDKGRPA